MNPFSEEYLTAELAHYGLKETYSKDGLSVSFNERGFPILRFDNQIWMSLRPNIIQSHYLTIGRAKGAVLAGGLGLGYFPLRVAAKENVHRVDVYELDGRCIDFFKELFSHRPEMEKINLIQGDLKELASGQYDYALVDIYINPVSSISQVLQDIALLKSRITVERIQAWCEELIIKSGIVYGLDIPIDAQEQEFFDDWSQAPSSIRQEIDQLSREARHHLSPWTIRSYLSLVDRPVNFYYLYLLKRGFARGIKLISQIAPASLGNYNK